jgi:predicted ATPase/class 3 adenylate cyclase
VVEQPTGTVTLLFTDIEGSTRLLERLGPERYRESLEVHRRLLRDAFERHGGYEVDYEGDAFFVAFARATDAVDAASEAQQALARAEWPEGQSIRVRMGIHTGEPLAAPPKYVGLDVHKAARIMAAGHGGQVLVSAATERLLDRGQPLRDLGEHRLKDLSQAEPLYQLLVPGGFREFPALKTLGNRPNNLPVVATPFVGRVAELGHVRDLLSRSDVRLLTLKGPGGVGKTRLALQAAADCADAFADGAFWVPLAAVRAPGLVAAAVASALGLREERDEPIDETLVHYLAGRSLLLVLDNFEHVVEAATLAASLLSAAPHVKVVVTTRERLRLTGEHVYEVPSMAVDGPTADAEELFVTRARAADAGFDVRDDAPFVEEIVRRLDGLPLAIELAAARVGALPPRALAKRLDDRFALLTSGARDSDPRQQTLLATISWSYDLLTPAEQRLLALLGVFVGGFRLDAAAAVTEWEASDVLAGIASLLDKSLIRRRADPDGEPRYWLLETIREFALARLAETADETDARLRHARWYRDLVQATDNRVRSAELRARLEPDAFNVRAALAAFAAAGAVDDEVRLAAQVAPSDYLRGTASEGRALITTAIAGGTPSDEALGYALDALAWLAHLQGDNAESLAHAEAALAAARRADRPALEAECLLAIGAGSFGLADVPRARASYEAALARATEIGDDVTVAAALVNLSDLLLGVGENEQARVIGAQAATASERVGNDAARAAALSNLACAELALGDIDAAHAHALQALDVIREVEREAVGSAVLVIAAAKHARGDDELAARLLGTADALIESTGCVLGQVEAALRERVAVALRQAFGAERFEGLYSSGQELDERAAI